MENQPTAAASRVRRQYEQYVNPTFVKLLGTLGYGRIYSRAEGVWVWDDQGRKYLDFLAGFGSANIGHNHPRLRDSLIEYLHSSPLNLCHTGLSPYTARLAARLAEIAPGDLEISLLASSGAEAVEAAMKLARIYTGRKGYLYCQGGFHGTNLGSLSIMGEKRMRRPFEPLLSDSRQVTFGDLEALEKALKTKTMAAFICEPIQAEGGVVLPPPGYLGKARDLCQKYGTLFVLDEVQTGLGRAGTFFACQREGVIPDVMVLAKALSGSLVPVSAALTTGKIFEKCYGKQDRFDLHSSTFGGNGLSCIAALSTLDIIEEEKLVARSERLGNLLREKLEKNLSDHPLVRQVRGRGLLVGVELGPTSEGWLNRLAPFLVRLVSKNAFGQWVALRLLEEGVICQPASHAWNVLRFEPPLTVKEEHIEEVAEKTTKVLFEYQRLTPLLKDLFIRLRQQQKKEWAFL